MRKKFSPKCPTCGSTNISGWYNEHNMTYNIRCETCARSAKVFNIKYIEAFPEWFEVEEEIEDE